MVSKYHTSRMYRRLSLGMVIILLLTSLIAQAHTIIAASTSSTSQVSVASDGTPGDRTSFSSVMSGDGRYVAFLSFASNLVAGDVNINQSLYVRDRQLGETRLIAHSRLNAQAVSEPDISADGRYITFSAFDNLLGDRNFNVPDFFIYDQQTSGRPHEI